MIELRGAREHHLHDLDLDLVPGTWTAIVGPSGSGKSTLLHDTLVAEGRRRWLAQLRGPARKLLGKAGRPALDRLDGLPLPVAIGAVSTGSDRSTVGTRSGLLDLLRLVWARETGLSRSHFSFNHPLGACEACRGHGVQDFVDPELIVADARKSIRDGALVPTLKSGYTVYSQVTVDVMDQLCQAHGFTVDTPWQELSDEQRHMVFHGTDRLVVPFGKHDLASRMRWSGITARPREEGHYKGLIPTIEATLKRDRNPNILRFVRSVPCEVCHGCRLGEAGRTAVVAGRTLPDVVESSLSDVAPLLHDVLATPTGQAVADAVHTRLERLVELDLGHLTLARTLPTLSGGEAQRLAFAALLGTELCGLLFALDEPTLGLHPDAQEGLRRALRAVLERGNTVVTVEHDPDFVRHADRVLALGPGGGSEGGNITSDGPTPADPLGGPPSPRPPRPGTGTLRLEGATRRCLVGDDLVLRTGALNVVLGRSGAGKSTLVMGCLLDALQGTKRADAGTLDADVGKVQALDASPLGRTPRSTPATWTGWFDHVRKRFAATDAAKNLGLKAGAFAYNHKAGRCPACEGLGVERIRLHLLEDLLRTCPVCDGGRYGDEVLQVRWRGLTIAEVLQLPVASALEQLGDDDKLAPLLHALDTLGLGHLPLGQPSPTLSRGEAQRVRLATVIAGADRPGILLLDEPDRGLHPGDLQHLLAALDRLVDAGHTVVAISHHRHVWAAADQRIRVHDGRIEVDPELSWERLSTAAPQPPTPPPATLSLRGVRTHHLHLDVGLPRDRLVGIVGVSGAGKSSLVAGTLAAEAERRLAETLPFAVRRHLRAAPRPVLDSAHGLGPVVLLRQLGPETTTARSSVGTALDVDALLRLLFSRAGTVDGEPTDLSAAHFSPNRTEGACPACSGRRRVQVATESSLITDPTLPLFDGAMSGTKTGAYLGEPDGQFAATLRASLLAHDLDPACLIAPWQELTDAVRTLALHGAEGELTVTWTYQRGKRSGEHDFIGPWSGLVALAEEEARRRANRKDAASWATCLVEVPCGACDGSGLHPDARAVRVGGHSLESLVAVSIDQLLPTLDRLDGRPGAVARALRPELARRLDEAVALGLGAVALHTPVARLTSGDRQRVRLAAVLGSGLSSLTLVLDEPAAGLPDDGLPALLDALRRAASASNTVLVVTHRVAVMRAMDHLVELGPGRGPDGGRIVGEGPPDVLATLDTPTGRLLRDGPPDASWGTPWEGGPVPDRGLLRVATSDLARHLPDLVVAPPARGETVLDAVDGLKDLQKLYGPLSDLPARAFSFRSPAGRCPACDGSGVETVALDVLADLRLPCPSCGGRRYRPEVFDVRWQGLDVASFLDQPVDALRQPLLQDGSKPARRLAERAAALSEVGLGALAWSRPVATLSGGERQRLVLAAAGPDAPPLWLVDPFRGLHPADRPTVLGRLDALARRRLVVVETP